MTFAECLFLAPLHRRRRAVLSSLAGIGNSYRVLLDFFDVLDIFRIQKYTERNLGPITLRPHTVTRRILER